MAADDFAVVREHLFPGDRDEHAAIALAGVGDRPGRVDLFVREVHLLGEDEFVPGEFGYRQISPSALARLGTRAHAQRLALVTLHSHPGASTHNALSRDDLNAHRRVFPHLLDIVGGPVAGIAVGTASAAGEIWTRDGGATTLVALEVSGPQRLHLPPRPETPTASDERFDRQALLFGVEGQRILARQHVAVVGLGGGGSILVEQLAHLGVGRITGVDFDVVKRHNLSRIVGSTEDDARRARKKVDVAARHVDRIGGDVRFTAIVGDLSDPDTARAVSQCDFIFLATDTITSRLVANAISQAFLIPMIQIGAKVDLRADGEIESVYAAVRPALPRRGCLACAGVIDPHALREEANSDEERAAQNYLGTPVIADPSVITLNGIGASAAVHTFLMSAVGLAEPELFEHRLFEARGGRWLSLRVTPRDECPWCGRGERSAYGRGAEAALPVRTVAHEAPSRNGRLERLFATVRRART